MEIPVTPQGIMSTLTVVFAIALAWINRSWFTALKTPASTETDTVPDELPVDSTLPHVLDVMKTLTEINEDQCLKCENELTNMYSKIVRRNIKTESPTA